MTNDPSQPFDHSHSIDGQSESGSPPAGCENDASPEAYGEPPEADHTNRPPVYSEPQGSYQQAPYPTPIQLQKQADKRQYDYSAPFSEATATMPKGGGSGGKAVLWAVLGAVFALLAAGIVYFILTSLKDPFRTLDVFPTEKYLSNYESVVGSRFQVSVSVVAELGGSYEEGRLLTFRDEVSQEALAILVPTDLGGILFSKGQSYVAEIEVGQGGLIYAHEFKKN